MSKTTITNVWTSRPFITRAEVEAITAKASRLDRLKLKFRRTRYSLDNGTMIRYKLMGNTVYVLPEKTLKEAK